MSLKIFDCVDKNHKEKFDPDDLFRLPLEFRCIITGAPGTGKSSLIKNILLNCTSFKKIYLHHGDGNSNEYDLIKHTKMQKVVEIPELINSDSEQLEDDENPLVDYKPEKGFKESKDKKDPILIIFEDFNFESLTKPEKVLMLRYFSVYSSHNNISLILSVQNPFGVPPSLKRFSTHFIMYKSHDKNQARTICGHYGIDKKTVDYIFKQCLKDKYDFILFDFNAPSEYKYRKNFTDCLLLE